MCLLVSPYGSRLSDLAEPDQAVVSVPLMISGVPRPMRLLVVSGLTIISHQEWNIVLEKHIGLF